MTRPANHDQFKNHHTHSQADGYKEVEYEHQEYPKVVGKDADNNDVIANNADEEQAFFDSQEEK